MELSQRRWVRLTAISVRGQSDQAQVVSVPEVVECVSLLTKRLFCYVVRNLQANTKRTAGFLLQSGQPAVDNQHFDFCCFFILVLAPIAHDCFVEVLLDVLHFVSLVHLINRRLLVLFQVGI